MGQTEPAALRRLALLRASDACYRGSLQYSVLVARPLAISLDHGSVGQESIYEKEKFILQYSPCSIFLRTAVRSVRMHGCLARRYQVKTYGPTSSVLGQQSGTSAPGW